MEECFPDSRLRIYIGQVSGDDDLISVHGAKTDGFENRPFSLAQRTPKSLKFESCVSQHHHLQILKIELYIIEKKPKCVCLCFSDFKILGNFIAAFWIRRNDSEGSRLAK